MRCFPSRPSGVGVVQRHFVVAWPLKQQGLLVHQQRWFSGSQVIRNNDKTQQDNKAEISTEASTAGKDTTDASNGRVSMRSSMAMGNRWAMLLGLEPQPEPLRPGGQEEQEKEEKIGQKPLDGKDRYEDDDKTTTTSKDRREHGLARFPPGTKPHYSSPPGAPREPQVNKMESPRPKRQGVTRRARGAFSLQGRHAVVNGATGFLGSHVARALAAEGCVVTLLGRNEEKLKEVLRTIQGGIDDIDDNDDGGGGDATASSSTWSKPYPGHDFVAMEQGFEGNVDAATQIHFDEMGLPLELCPITPSEESPPPRTRRKGVFSRRPTAHSTSVYTDEPSMVEALDRIRLIDVLVNCQGYQNSGVFLGTRVSERSHTLDVNLTLTMEACRAASRALVRVSRRDNDEGGRVESSLAVGFTAVIINVSSLLGVMGGRGSASYAAAKAGVIGFTRAFSAEMGPLGVRVNCLVPGYIEGGGMVANYEQRHRRLSETRLSERRIPLGRYGDVESMVDGVLFLARNSYASNCVLNLDGGLSASGIY